MTDSLPPGLILILGALLLPLFRGRARQAWLVLLPVLSLWQVLSYLPLDAGESIEFGKVALFGHTLTVVRIDKLSLAFGVVFHIAALLNVIYALHVKDAVQHVSALIYAGSAIGGAFAGDLITLFVYWELTAISSVFLVWASRTESAYRAGMRYLLVQVGSGVLVLAGIVLLLSGGASIEFRSMTAALERRELGAILIFLGFGVKAAFPLLHNWLQDAYPQATPTGTVFLSAFTTKMAIYALARGFPGAEILIPIGAVMAVFPLFYAAIENDLRKVLAYILNNQLGYMVVGIGIGGFGISGAVAQAFCHVLYKALLFMSMGAVLYRAGTVRASDLGGLYKSMPWTTVFCSIGALSMAAPLLCGFVSKSIVIGATAEAHLTFVWFVLVAAAAGVFLAAGIKVPFCAFFGRDSGLRCKEAPWNMLLAMGLAAVLCIGIGVWYQPLYALLPGELPDSLSHPYTTTHVVPQLQLLFFSAVAFVILKKTGVYALETRATYLDTDWFYRRVPAFLWTAIGPVRRAVMGTWVWGFESLGKRIFGIPGAEPGTRKLPRQWSLSRIVVLTGLMLLGYLLIVFFTSATGGQ